MVSQMNEKQTRKNADDERDPPPARDNIWRIVASKSFGHHRDAFKIPHAPPSTTQIREEPSHGACGFRSLETSFERDSMISQGGCTKRDYFAQTNPGGRNGLTSRSLRSGGPA